MNNNDIQFMIQLNHNQVVFTLSEFIPHPVVDTILTCWAAADRSWMSTLGCVARLTQTSYVSLVTAT